MLLLQRYELAKLDYRGFVLGPAASKNVSLFKSGQKRLRNNNLALSAQIRDTFGINVRQGCRYFHSSSPWEILYNYGSACQTTF